MSDEKHKYEMDVFYEAWRRGLNPDNAVNCADDCYWNQRTPEQCVDGYQSRLRNRREQAEMEQMREHEEYEAFCAASEPPIEDEVSDDRT